MALSSLTCAIVRLNKFSLSVHDMRVSPFIRPWTSIILAPRGPWLDQLNVLLAGTTELLRGDWRARGVNLTPMIIMMMMESPVGTTYELRPSSIDCVSSCGR